MIETLTPLDLAAIAVVIAADRARSEVSAMSFTHTFHLNAFHTALFRRHRTGPHLTSLHRLRRAIADAPLTSPVLHCLPAPRPTPLRQLWGTTIRPDGTPHLEARWRADTGPP